MYKNERGKYRAAANSPLFAAAITATYAAIFFSSGNATMLPTGAMLLLWVVLTVPFLVAIWMLQILLRKTGFSSYNNFLVLLISVCYLLLLLREPLFAAPWAKEFRGQFTGASWIVVHLVLFIVPAVAIAALFRKDIPKYLFVILSMIASSVVLNTFSFNSPSVDSLGVFGAKTARQFEGVTFSETPNIYFFLADSLGSIAYFKENRIDLGEITKNFLESDFRLYDDVYSNYHPTTSSMLSTLNMEHHHYSLGVGASEVTKHGRQIIAGRNNLIVTLRRNGYKSEYLHQAKYLMLQGCFVDKCFPRPTDIAAAGSILLEVLPEVFVSNYVPANSAWRNEPLEGMRKKLRMSIEQGMGAENPWFRYVHLYDPFHPQNSVMGTCDESIELTDYSARVKRTGAFLAQSIGDIVTRDPGAVVIVSGDHGPFISNNCIREFDISSKQDYRDRVGSFLAIRWPKSYDGQYDHLLKTNVNLFRYVLASIAESPEELIKNRAVDDVFVQGESNYLQIMESGEILIPPTILRRRNDH